jgi:signal peptidase II|tara:strand:- start:39443 stop:39967 length:525 start_codon:yes stop_codon:yes gene_type:complete
VKYKIFFVILILAAMLDQATKTYIATSFSIGESVDVIPNFFNLTYIQNYGVAFGFLASLDPLIRTPLLILFPLVAFVVILMMLKGTRENDLFSIVSFSLIAGGALGNLSDRIRLGFVVDFLDFHYGSQWHYPAFNVADISICLGVGVLLILTIRVGRKEAKLKAHQNTREHTKA